MTYIPVILCRACLALGECSYLQMPDELRLWLEEDEDSLRPMTFVQALAFVHDGGRVHDTWWCRKCEAEVDNLADPVPLKRGLLSRFRTAILGAKGL